MEHPDFNTSSRCVSCYWVNLSNMPSACEFLDLDREIGGLEDDCVYAAVCEAVKVLVVVC